MLVDQFWMQDHGDLLYLFAIATQPAQQGQGLGNQLMKAITARADEMRLPAYLEVQCYLQGLPVFCEDCLG